MNHQPANSARRSKDKARLEGEDHPNEDGSTSPTSDRSPVSPLSQVQLAYYTRSKKKSARDKRTSDEGASPSSHGGHAPGGGEPSVVTRSRAPRSSMSGAGSNHGEDQDQAHQAVAIFFPEEGRNDVEMQEGDREGGSASNLPPEGGSIGAGESGAGARQDVRPGVINAQNTARTKNPVIRLTVKLLDTYQDINEKYYAKHSKRSQDQWDDEHGDYIIRAGDMINQRYKIVKRPNGSSPLLGKGSFGQVVFAIDTKAGPYGHNTGRTDVALKIIKNHHHWYEQAKCEIALLRRFTQRRPVERPDGKQVDWVDHANVVRLVDDFVFRNHCCLVFELLPFTLYDLLKYSRFKGVSLQLVSKFAGHLLRSLDCLRDPDVDVIHCDLKPENVMLVKHDDHRVKVIDFGSSCSSKRQPFTYIQSRFYRSPEVLLCSPYSHAIDMWSLGCILVEMHTGQPLFNGKNEAEQIWKISEVLGLPPERMVRNAGAKSKVKSLFKYEGGKYVINVNGKTLKGRTKEFRQIIRKPTSPPYTMEQECMYAMFEDLVYKMLAFDPEVRITPEQALKHPFVSSQGPLVPPASAARSDSMDMDMSPRGASAAGTAGGGGGMGTGPAAREKVDGTTQTRPGW